MEHEDFPVRGFEFMNEPATVEQKTIFIQLAAKLGENFKIEGPWPEPFTKWDAKLAIDALLEKVEESKRCQAVFTERETGEQRACGAIATHTAHIPPIPFCDSCLHDCMEDASPEEQATVKVIPRNEP